MKKALVSVILACAVLLCSCANTADNITTATTINTYNTTAIDNTTTSVSKNTLASTTAKVNEPTYTLAKIDGQSYIVPQGDLRDISKVGAVIQIDLVFDSLEEMIDSIKNNKLHPGDIEKINSLWPKDGNGVKMFDTDNIYYPTASEKITVNKMSWLGERYSYMTKLSSGTSCKFRYLTEEKYNKQYEELVNWTDNELIKVTETFNIEERNAVVTYHETSAGRFKRISYTVQVGEKTLYVLETYVLYMKYQYTDIIFSETVPDTISIVGKDDEVRFYLYLSNMTQRPSEELIASLGMEKYNK